MYVRYYVGHKNVCRQFIDKLNEWLNFNPICWYLTMVISLGYAITMGWLGMAQNYLIKKYDFSQNKASNYLSLFMILPVIFTGLTGFIADKKGKRIHLLLFSTIIISILHIG